MNPSDCPFCNQDIKSRIVAEHGSVFAVYDRFPVTEGHLLILPKRHTADWFSLTEEERHDAEKLILCLREKLLADDPTISGFNIGVNCGASAGQTIFHAHIHLIPRRDGDTDDPRGGVRGVIPHKQKY
jgi:diadenosine tetraphosphate (Ap4A) HIT family hydrolase